MSRKIIDVTYHRNEHIEILDFDTGKLHLQDKFSLGCFHFLFCTGISTFDVLWNILCLCMHAPCGVFLTNSFLVFKTCMTCIFFAL
jgi:hypothetical protein